jgi:LPXTG-motif cell wall-anchored protein
MVRSDVRGRLCAVVALFIALFAGAIAVPQTASAYPAPVCSVSVHPTVVRGGHPVTVDGKSNAPRNWRVTFLGHTVQHSGRTFHHVFQTPRVQHKEIRLVHVSCAGTTQNVAVTLLPPRGNNHHHGNGNGSGLPNTGGPPLWLLLAGVVLLVAGGEALRRSRRTEARAPTR